MKKHVWLAGLLSGIAAIFLVGCGGGGSAPSQSSIAYADVKENLGKVFDEEDITMLGVGEDKEDDLEGKEIVWWNSKNAEGNSQISSAKAEFTGDTIRIDISHGDTEINDAIVDLDLPKDFELHERWRLQHVSEDVSKGKIAAVVLTSKLNDADNDYVTAGYWYDSTVGDVGFGAFATGLDEYKKDPQEFNASSEACQAGAAADKCNETGTVDVEEVESKSFRVSYNRNHEIIEIREIVSGGGLATAPLDPEDNKAEYDGAKAKFDAMAASDLDVSKFTFAKRTDVDIVPNSTNSADDKIEATFSGVAAGFYVKDYNNSENTTDHFVGKVSLTLEDWEIGGKITDIEYGEGTRSSGPASLTLNDTPLQKETFNQVRSLSDGKVTNTTTSTAATYYQNHFAGSWSDSGFSGNWNGRLYGTVPSTEPEKAQPSSVAGTFHGKKNREFIGGAFGAE